MVRTAGEAAVIFLPCCVPTVIVHFAVLAGCGHCADRAVSPSSAPCFRPGAGPDPATLDLRRSVVQIRLACSGGLPGCGILRNVYTFRLIWRVLVPRWPEPRSRALNRCRLLVQRRTASFRAWGFFAPGSFHSLLVCRFPKRRGFRCDPLYL